MKKRYLSSLLVLLMLLALIIPSKVQAYSPWISETKVSVYKGGTYNLEIYGTSKKVTWSSTDKSIVKVNKKGIITGVNNGKAKVKAKIGKKTYSCTVNVKDKAKYDIDVNGEYIKLTYTPNFGFSEFQPVITYYDKKGKELGKTEFTNSKVATKGIEMIDEKELPEYEYSYYEITFITEE
ncbi:Ig-like domain-containing protein [Anaerosporobacter sp.]